MDGNNSNGNGLEKSSLSLYTQLPETVHKSAGIDSDFVGDAVIEGFEADKVYSAKVKHKVFQLDNPAKEQTAATKEQNKKRKRANKSKALTAKEKRALHVYDIPLESRKYELFLPLNTLWKGYMSEVFGSTTPTAFTQKLLKADLHGAVITVIPKVNNVFSIPIRNSVFTLHGNQFRYRASQRSTKKFKSRPTIDL
ncbi:RNase P/RNase MRP complex subunit [Podila verticillata]|nr:RNase P/RNase MRP complex subunit [Podila verticillata]